MQLQRQAMEQRLGSSQSVQQNQASVAPSPAVATPAQGFLTRQRQAAARGRNTGYIHVYIFFKLKNIILIFVYFMQGKLQLTTVDPILPLRTENDV